MGRLIDEEDAINAILREYNKDDSDYPTDYQQGLHAAEKIIEQLPSAQPDSCLGSVISEIEKTISETRESGKHHDINVRTNGAMICFGLQLALEIIEEKKLVAIASPDKIKDEKPKFYPEDWSGLL